MCQKIQCLGIEVYYQVAMQITLLLLTSSKTLLPSQILLLQSHNTDYLALARHGCWNVTEVP